VQPVFGQALSNSLVKRSLYQNRWHNFEALLSRFRANRQCNNHDSDEPGRFKDVSPGLRPNADTSLAKILSADQQKQLKEMHSRRPPRRAGPEGPDNGPGYPGKN